MGVVGLECAFAVLNTALVKRGVISFERLVEAMAIAPRRIFSLGGGVIAAGEPADLTVVDTERSSTVDPDRFLSMAQYSLRRNGGAGRGGADAGRGPRSVS